MPEPQSHTARWRMVGFALSAVGSMLFAIKGVLIKLIYAYHVDPVTLLEQPRLFFQQISR